VVVEADAGNGVMNSDSLNAAPGSRRGAIHTIALPMLVALHE